MDDSPLYKSFLNNISVKGVIHESGHVWSVMGMRGEVAIMRLIPKLVRLSDTSMLEKVKG